MVDITVTVDKAQIDKLCAIYEYDVYEKVASAESGPYILELSIFSEEDEDPQFALEVFKRGVGMIWDSYEQIEAGLFERTLGDSELLRLTITIK